MVEGHQCARVIHWHRARLVNKKFACSSPNGRFADGARAIDGCVLTRAEHIGKNLFYFFQKPAGADATKGPGAARRAGSGGSNASTQATTTVVHVHFGMSGRLKTFATADEPETTPTTRLRLVAEDNSIGGHLSAMTVKHGGLDLFEAKMAELQEQFRSQLELRLNLVLPRRADRLL